MFRFGFFCVFLAALAAPLCAQDNPCLQRAMPVYVYGLEGRQIANLTAADFVGQFRAKPVKILSIHSDTRPHQVAILLDASGSMTGEPRGAEWKIARAIASHIVRSQLRDTSFALLIFSEKVEEQMDFSQGTAVVARRLAEIGNTPSYAKKNVRGPTALFDAILAAINLFESYEASNSIFLISDGGENSSHARQKDVLHALIKSGVRLNFVALKPGGQLAARTLPPEDVSGPRDIVSLVQASGGTSFGPVGLLRFGEVEYDYTDQDRKVLAARLTQVYSAIVNDDVLEIELPQRIEKWGKWNLRFSNEKEPVFKGATIVYPKELAPCSDTP